jgi:GNAT superfamily N-acetyltransferase
VTGTQSLTIRPIGAEDYPVWHALWTGYLSFYETALPEETYTTSFARLLSDDPATLHGRLAEIAGVCVGLVHVVFHPHMWRAAPMCYLQDLYTAPEARGAGVARRLIEADYAEADARGAPQVYWLTQELNYRGRMLYDKVGRKTPFIRYDRPLA